MAEASDTLGMLVQNFRDAGCDEKFISGCMEQARQGNWAAILPLLAQHKQKLLVQRNTSEQQIDCLDFLIYRINKEHK